MTYTDLFDKQYHGDYFSKEMISFDDVALPKIIVNKNETKKNKWNIWLAVHNDMPYEHVGYRSSLKVAIDAASRMLDS